MSSKHSMDPRGVKHSILKFALDADVKFTSSDLLLSVRMEHIVPFRPSVQSRVTIFFDAR